MKPSTDWSAYAPTRTVNDLTLWVETDRKKLEDRSGRDKLPVTSACAQLRQAEELLLLKEPAEADTSWRRRFVSNTVEIMSPSWLGNIGNIGKCPTGGGAYTGALPPRWLGEDE